MLLLTFPPWLYVVSLIVWIYVWKELTIFTVSIYVHRHLAHQALEFHPFIKGIFRFILWFTTGMKRKQWVAVHRRHHAYTDAEGDPHSPWLEGFYSILFGQALYYRRWAEDRETCEKFAKDIPDDDFFSRWHWSGVMFFLALTILLFAVPGKGLWFFFSPGIFTWTLLIAVIPLGGGVINGLGHWNTAPEAVDKTRNVVKKDFVLAGELLHFNHHAHLWSAKFEHRPGEVDSGWRLILLLGRLGLARNAKYPDPQGNPAIDSLA